MILVESTPSGRAAYFTYLLMSGRELTARQLADEASVSIRTAQRTLETISQQVPIFRGDDGRWVMVESGRVEISPL